MRGFAGGAGDGGGVCDRRNRCLCVNAPFAGSVKFRGNEAVAARTAIPAAMVWLWEWWWEWWWYRVTGGFGPSCDRGDSGGDGSNGSSSRRCAHRRSRRRSHLHQSRNGTPVVGLVGWWWCWWWLLVLCGDGSDSKNRVPPKTVSCEHLFRPLATQHNSWEVVFTHRNELLHDPQEPSHPQRFMGDLFHHSKRATPTIRITCCDPPSDRPPQ